MAMYPLLAGVARVESNPMALNKAEQARAKAERSALAKVLRERARSNASGAHNNTANRRARTRSARLAKAVSEWQNG